MNRKSLLIGSAIVVAAALWIAGSIIRRCMIAPQSQDCSVSDLQDLQSLEQSLEGTAQLFNKHETALLDFFSSHQKQNLEFNDVARAHWLAGMVTDDLRFALTLAEVYGNVCSRSDRARIGPVIEHHLSHILSSFHIQEAWIKSLALTAPDEEMKARRCE